MDNTNFIILEDATDEEVARVEARDESQALFRFARTVLPGSPSEWTSQQMMKVMGRYTAKRYTWS